ncbi:MAG: hypothetical protein EA397_14915 [Deltaproteobacteria bacterium]|nr:MAG: hypothetical protein EA397_14915 [Deltaproteobacteria bacterium]
MAGGGKRGDPKAIMLSYVGAGAVGLVVGAVAIAWLLPPQPGASGLERAEAGPRASNCAAEPQALDPLRERVEATELHANVLRGQIALLGGISEPWPPGTDPEDERAQVLAEAHDVLEASLEDLPAPFELRSDCEESPCIVVLIVGPGDEPLDVVLPMPLRGALAEAVGPGGSVSAVSSRAEREGLWSVTTFIPTPKTDDVSRVERTRVRVERVHDESFR